MKLKKYEKNPIIAPNPANAWENLVTCNPGVIYDDGRFYCSTAPPATDKEHVIRLGLAVSENGFDFRRVGDSPVFGPSADGPDGGCVEDPRIVKFDNEFYLPTLPRPCPRAVLDFRARRGASAPMRSLCAGRHGAEPGKYGACRDVRLPEFPPAGAAYVARARRSGRDPFPGENRREVRHDAPSQTVRGRTLRGEIPFDLAEVLRRPAGMGGPSPAICLSPAAKEPGRRRSAEARRRS